jgi:monovalent cation:H+ antiporter-2, CPA2 family
VTFSTSIVSDFAVIMVISAVVFFIFNRLKQPTILGYLIAGVIIGPYTPPFSLVTNLNVLGAVADLGVILLLFAIGLRFPLTKLRSVGKISIGVAAIEIVVMLLISFGIGWLLKWPLMDSLFLGTALASSSTVIIAKVLGDMGKLESPSTLVMLGVLVVEDLIVVGLLATITSSADSGSLDFSIVGWQIAKILAFVFGSLALGLLIIPRIINKIVKIRNNELIILVVLGLCFGLSMVANLMGFSMAIGAFLMGVIIASATSIDKVESLVSPVKDMFAAMFFVSMGALIDISQFRIFLLPALLITALMVFGKMFGCGLGTKIFGKDINTSFKVGLGMSQIGEFAFIVIKAGQDANLISSYLFPIVGVAAAITTFLTPYLIKLSYRVDLTKYINLFKRRSIV